MFPVASVHGVHITIPKVTEYPLDMFYIHGSRFAVFAKVC